MPADAGEVTDGVSDIVDRVIKGRSAARSFTDRLVAQEVVTGILDVARYAPSGGNIQPWRVHVVAGEKKTELSAALSAAHETARADHASEYRYYSDELPAPFSDRRSEWGQLFYGSLGIDQSDMEARGRQTARNYLFFGAPVGLIVTIDRRLERGSWVDLGMFVQNVLLAAGARGLQTCPQETFAKYHAVLRRHLPIDESEIVVCGISLGYADEAARARAGLMPKAAVESFCSFTGFA